MQGCLDWPSGQELIGWVWNPAEPATRLTVEVTLDGTLIRRREASDFRGDLPDAGVGDGRYAFSVVLPDVAFDGAPHILAVTVDGQHLSGSPLTYQSIYAGAFEAWTRGGREVRGTLVDHSRRGTSRLRAELWVGSFRKLAETAVQADGTFVFELPAAFALSASSRLELRPSGSQNVVAAAAVEPAGEPATVLREVRETLTGARAADRDRALASRLIPLLASIPIGEVRLRPVRSQQLTLSPGVADPRTPVDLIIVGTDGSEAFLRTLHSIQASRVRQAYEVFPCHDRTAGFTIHTDRDCVVISEGALVSGDWLDRLRRAAYASALTASASPLTGHAGGEDPASIQLRGVWQQAGQTEEIALFSNICAYIRRDAWVEAGADLGLGKQLGWRHVAAGDVWVEAPAVATEPDVTHSTRLFAVANPKACALPEVLPVICTGGGQVEAGGRRYRLPEERDALLNALQAGGVKRIQVSTAVNAPAALFAVGIPYEIAVTDYSWICPRTNLVDETARYCGEPAIEVCERCFARLGPREDWVDLLTQPSTVAHLREHSARILAGAAGVDFPSEDTAARLLRYVDVRAAKRVTHGAPAEALPVAASNTSTVAFVGDAQILDACRYDAFKRGLPLQFSNGLSEGFVLLYANPGPDTSAVRFAGPVVTFDIGATGAVVRSSARGCVLPVDATAAQINDALLRQLPQPSAVASIADSTVDIVMPVYSGVEETRAAIQSVLDSTIRQPYELIVVFDNPGDAAMRAVLAEFSARITILENERNLGFVASANRGMSLHPGRDILLLNSDILAPKSDWLDRIRSAAYRSPRNGTVTPFSNNATICSYPRFCRNNKLPEGWDVTGLDAHCRATLPDQTLELPTTVGFCMYIRAACLAETGLFDVAKFGQGYGEENDFCMRATARGWKHVLCADAFVQHLGSVSFGTGAAASHAAAAYEKLKVLHPAYGPAVEEFLLHDPVLPLRRQLDLVRLKPFARGVTCLASNLLPGGTERHVQELAQAARERGEPVLFLRYSDAEHVEIAGFDNQRYRLPEELPALRDALRELGVARMHIHQTVDAPVALFDLGLPYEVTVHDYAWICPQIKLIDRTGQYCGEPDVHVCEVCYATLGPHSDWPNVAKRMGSVTELREQSRRHLEAAERVQFPSRDAMKRMQRYVNIRDAVVRLHDERPPMPRRWRRAGDEPARIVFIGGLTHAKGFDVLYRCALDALKRRLPLSFTVAGACEDARLLRDVGVRVLGPYLEGEIHGILDEIQPNVAFFPGQWPETFSYTLSIAFDAGVWPVAYDLGAIGERVRQQGFGRLMQLDTPIAQVNDLLWGEA